MKFETVEEGEKDEDLSIFSADLIDFRRDHLFQHVFDGQEHISTASHIFTSTFIPLTSWKIYIFMSENNCRLESLIVSSQFHVTPRKEISVRNHSNLSTS